MSKLNQVRIYFRANGEANSYSLFDHHDNWWMTIQMNGEQTTAAQAENLERMAACWNACDGIALETLENVGTDHEFWPIGLDGNSRKGLITLLGIQNFTVQALKKQVESETRAKLKAQREELLEALKAARQFIADLPLETKHLDAKRVTLITDVRPTLRVLGTIDAAIAKAEAA